MSQIIKLILISLVLFSCSPQKRIARIKKNNPGIVICRPDFILDTTVIDSICIDTFYLKDTSTIGLDTVLINVPDSIAELVRIIYKSKPCFKDTFQFTEKNITVKIWELNGKIKFSVIKPKEIIVNKIEAEYPELTYKLTWWQELRLNVFWLLLIILIILIIIKR